MFFVVCTCGVAEGRVAAQDLQKSNGAKVISLTSYGALTASGGLAKHGYSFEHTPGHEKFKLQEYFLKDKANSKITSGNIFKGLVTKRGAAFNGAVAWRWRLAFDKALGLRRGRQ